MKILLIFLKIQAVIRVEKSGLGATSSTVSIDLGEKEKKKLLNWSKTSQRYNKINTSEQITAKVHSAFNETSDDDDDDGSGAGGDSVVILQPPQKLNKKLINKKTFK